MVLKPFSNHICDCVVWASSHYCLSSTSIFATVSMVRIFRLFWPCCFRIKKKRISPTSQISYQSNHLQRHLPGVGPPPCYPARVWPRRMMTMMMMLMTFLATAMTTNLSQVNSKTDVHCTVCVQLYSYDKCSSRLSHICNFINLLFHLGLLVRAHKLAI